MKKFVGVLCLLLLSTALFADMTKAELQKMYLDYLKGRGISAEIDSDGDIEFLYKGQYFPDLAYYIIVNEDDQEYFCINKSSGYPLDTAEEKSRAPAAAAFASIKSYVAKVYVNQSGNNIGADASVFIASPEDFKALFPKLMRELDTALARFVNQMQ